MSTLSIDQKRILLAEWAGLKMAIGFSQECWLGETSDSEVVKRFKPRTIVVKDEQKRPTGLYRVPIPSYFTSLDAVAELEARLTDEEHTHFRVILFNLIDSDQKGQGQFILIGPREFVSATAAQRAEAIGQTVNLWKQP